MSDTKLTQQIVLSVQYMVAIVVVVGIGCVDPIPMPNNKAIENPPTWGPYEVDLARRDLELSLGPSTITPDFLLWFEGPCLVYTGYEQLHPGCLPGKTWVRTSTFYGRDIHVHVVDPAVIPHEMAHLILLDAGLDPDLDHTRTELWTFTDKVLAPALRRRRGLRTVHSY